MHQKEALVQYFRAGCKPDGAFFPGMEVEHFITHADGTPLDFAGVQSLMQAMQQKGGQPIWIDGLYMGYNRSAYGISLEPACQLEISIMPQRSAGALMEIYNAFVAMLTPLLAARGLRLWAMGYHPTRRAAELPLIPKKRYGSMDRHFQKSGHHGMKMMRATASTQVSVDYFSEADFIKKYRAANLLTPLFALLTDNTPFYEGAENHAYSRRTEIWMDVDAARCGVVPTLMDQDFGFAAYAAYILQQPLIVVKHGEETQDAGGQNALQAYGPLLQKADIEHILSMFFFDARLKNYIELRGADSMPPRYIAAYLQLVTAFFGSADAIDALLGRYAGATVADITAAKVAICKAGYAATIYGRPAAGEALWLLGLVAGMPGSEALTPLQALAAAQKTLWQAGHHNAPGA
ncbi:MAG: glutamate-cysteine ligase family protein [Gemmiger sp.]|nr:glutamate-cysteine ligase family protein [Gemmiger sp.]